MHIKIIKIARIITIILVLYIYIATKMYKYQVHTGRQSDYPSPSFTCSEHRHIYFLKVHKAASTTVANIFLRYGFLNNLNVLVFPRAKFSYPHRDFRHLLPRNGPVGKRYNPIGKYDIFCEHSVYDEKMLGSVLYKDTINIAILREPLSRLRSAFHYSELYDKLGIPNSPDVVERFLVHADLYASRSAVVRLLTKNMMAREFGYEGDVDVTKYLSYMESKFLVLIKEKLPESVVLMRRTLCWHIKDVIYFQLRQMSYNNAPVNHTIVRLHKEYSPWDYVFYDHFNAVMDSRIKAQPPEFLQEVELFKVYLTRTGAFCEQVCHVIRERLHSQNGRTAILDQLETSITFESTPFHTQFFVFGYDCLLMKFSPENYRQAMRMRYFPNECGKKYRKATVGEHFCHDYFKFNFPWSLLEDSEMHNTFLSPCV